MDLNLKGKSALVTGASQGIGEAIASELAKEGVGVAICSRRYAVLAETASRIKASTGSEVVPIAADLSKLEDVKTLVKQVAEKFGAIHILVNCAATPVVGKLKARFLDLPDEAWKMILETKYFGYIRCIREVLPYMIKQKDGRIVNISGIAGVCPNPIHLPGGSTNAAINLITKGLALEMGKYNIRVNAVLPGLIATERFTKLKEFMAIEKHASLEEVAEAYPTMMPLGRVGQPSEIADLVVFLVSDRSSYTTGDCLIVDGGRSLAYSFSPAIMPKSLEHSEEKTGLVK